MIDFYVFYDFYDFFGVLYFDECKYLFQSLIFKVHNCDTGKFFFLAWADFIVIEKKMNH